MIDNMIVFGDCRDMREIPDESIHLVVTSPPYFNAPFDYPNMFKDYDEYLTLIKDVAKELYRVLEQGRVACFVTQDVRIDGRLYPIPADILQILLATGFTYRDKIIWRKPEGYIRISRRSGVLIQHPYPMYFYPDNIYEEILIVQKGKYDYRKRREKGEGKEKEEGREGEGEGEEKGKEKEKEEGKEIGEVDDIVEASRINIEEFNREKWYLSVWDITNVLPMKGRIEEGIAAFPEAIPYRLIKLFSYVNEVVLDPFMGSGTTLKVAIELGRRAIGYEIDLSLIDVVKRRLISNRRS